MDYKGIIIEESLTDSSILKELQILEKEVEEVTEESNTPWLEKWTMYTVLIPEEKIEQYAQILSKQIDQNHCSDWYCDFKNEKYHYVIFSNKVFKLDRLKKEDYTCMKEYALKLGLPEYQLPIFGDL